jgi:hypothetical protein
MRAELHVHVLFPEPFEHEPGLGHTPALIGHIEAQRGPIEPIGKGGDEEKKGLLPPRWSLSPIGKACPSDAEYAKGLEQMKKIEGPFLLPHEEGEVPFPGDQIRKGDLEKESAEKEDRAPTIGLEPKEELTGPSSDPASKGSGHGKVRLSKPSKINAAEDIHPLSWHSSQGSPKVLELIPTLKDLVNLMGMKPLEQYREYCRTHEVPIFLDSSWAEAVSKDMGYGVSTVGGNGDLKGFFLYYLKRRYGFRRIILPPLTPYAGP